MAVVVYAPANISTPKADSGGGERHLAITTDYPFSDTVELSVRSDTPFPLHLRIPSWVASAAVTVDGGAVQHPAPGAFHTVAAGGGRTTTVRIAFDNEIRLEQGFNDSSVSVPTVCFCCAAAAEKSLDSS